MDATAGCARRVMLAYWPGRLDALNEGPAAPAGAAGLTEALAQVPDPGNPRGTRYPLVPVLVIAACGMLSHAAITG
jgi:hypothetical protein